MNANLAATIEAVTNDSAIKLHVEEVKDLGDKLGVRHDGDAVGRRWIENAAKENGMKIVAENDDAKMMVFA